MGQYIDKSALVAEIDALLDDEFQCNSYDEATGFQNALTLVKEFLDSLEVKEVDLEKELDSMITPELKFHKALPSLFDVAKHFFELGLKTQKGE